MYLGFFLGDRERAPWVKVSAAKPDDLSSILKPTWWETRTDWNNKARFPPREKGGRMVGKEGGLSVTVHILTLPNDFYISSLFPKHSGKQTKRYPCAHLLGKKRK